MMTRIRQRLSSLMIPAYITQADAGEVAEGNDKFGAALAAGTINRGGYGHEDD